MDEQLKQIYDTLVDKQTATLNAVVPPALIREALKELSWRVIFQELEDAHANPLEKLAIDVLRQSALLEKIKEE